MFPSPSWVESLFPPGWSHCFLPPPGGIEPNRDPPSLLHTTLDVTLLPNSAFIPETLILACQDITASDYLICYSTIQE